MPKVEDIIQITHNQSFLGQACTNIYHYYISSSDRDVMFGSEIEQFLLAWEQQWALTVGSLLSEDVNTTTLVYDNLIDPDEYRVVNGVRGGSITGPRDDSLSAIGFRLINNRRTVRTGHKRFAGVAEGSANGNILTLDTDNVALAESFLANGIGINTDVDSSADYTLTPVIVGRTKNANGTYVLDVNRFAFVTAAELNPLVTSQVSRKARNE